VTTLLEPKRVKNWTYRVA